MDLREHAERLRPVVARLPAYLKLLWRLVREPRLSRYSRGLLAAGAAYGLSPIDLVPGFLPVVGQLDDLLVLLYALRQALRRLPPDLQEQHLAACGLVAADLEADTAAVRQALGAAARGGLRAAGRAVAWGARLASRAAAWGMGQVAAALRRRRRRSGG